VAYVSLYRKHRPQSFAEIIGQEHVTVTLQNAVTGGRLHHAYLFTGPRGTGKTSTARILAKSINCEHGPTATPCNICVHCVGITAGNHVDVVEIDAASHGGVDDVRDLRERVRLAPATARSKVYIVDECHMLSTAGWNAFLKTVEEPPDHVLFVFATTEPHKVLPTILSRTQRFDFKRVAAGLLTRHAEAVAAAEGITLQPGAVELIVRAGDGSVRDALSVLEQVVAYTGPSVALERVVEVLGSVPDELLFAAVDRVADGDVARLCELVQQLADAGHDPRQFARDAVEHLRALFLLKTAPDAGLVDTTPDRAARLGAQAQLLGLAELLRAIDLLAEAQAQMRRGNTRLPLELALVKAALPAACGDPAAIAARMDRLERHAGGDPRPRPSPPPAAQPAQVAAPALPDFAAPASAERVPHEPATEGAGAVQPASERVAASGTSTVDLASIERAWDAVLEAVRRRKVRLHAYLLGAQAAGFDGETVTLAFRAGYTIHAEECASELGQEVIGAAFEEVLGVRAQLRCIVADGNDKPVPPGADEADAQRSEAVAVAESEAAEREGAPLDDTELHDRAVDDLTRQLGATVLQDGRDDGGGLG
jgi:DNA polymerase III subunit gamma/tau